MSREPRPSPVRTEGRQPWGRAVVAGRAVRAWADLTNRRTVLQLDVPDPRDLGVVVTIGTGGGRPVLLVNPQQAWANAPETRSRLLMFAVCHFRTAEATS
jgi:hypothetical protein